MPDLPLPDWLDGCRVPDSECAGAYEAMPARRRALLKKQIAALHALWGAGLEAGTTLERRLSSGLTIRERREPADWALFLMSGDFRSAPCLVAAVLPALLAGVFRILPCVLRKGKEPPAAPEVLAALDLLGQDQVFQLSEAQAAELLDGLIQAGRPDSGRLVLLGGAAAALAGRASPPRRDYSRRLKLGLDKQAGPDADLLGWAYPGALFADLPEDGRFPADLDAIFGRVDTCGTGSWPAPAVYGPGCEALWRWPDCGPDFFIRHDFMFGLGADEL